MTGKWNAVMQALAKMYAVWASRDPDMNMVMDALDELMKAYDAWLD